MIPSSPWQPGYSRRSIASIPGRSASAGQPAAQRMKKKGTIVSACLLGRRCRYNGEDKSHPGVIRFLRGKRVLALCPEMLAGWGAPRLPVQFHGGGAARGAEGSATVRD